LGSKPCAHSSRKLGSIRVCGLPPWSRSSRFGIDSGNFDTLRVGNARPLDENCPRCSSRSTRWPAVCCGVHANTGEVGWSRAIDTGSLRNIGLPTSRRWVLAGTFCGRRTSIDVSESLVQ
jgi:hypothetical protein